jgi:hypothetical protein
MTPKVANNSTSLPAVRKQYLLRLHLALAFSPRGAWHTPSVLNYPAGLLSLILPSVGLCSRINQKLTNRDGDACLCSLFLTMSLHGKFLSRLLFVVIVVAGLLVNRVET